MGKNRYLFSVVPVMTALIFVLTGMPPEAAEAPQRPTLEPGESNRVAPPRASRAVATFDLTSGLTRADLVDELVGPNVNVFSVGGSGDDRAAGLFSGGTGIVGIESGVILSSGDIASVDGPNLQDNVSTNNGTSGDPELAALSGFPSYDASVLEFEFDCSGSNEINITYVFSSDEYNEYVYSPYHDIFGVFLNGVNIATVPDTTLPIGIEWVNCYNPYSPPLGNSCDLFINNDCSDIPPYTFPCPGNRDTEMDGLTVVLTARGTVLPGPNSIKLAISDSSDSIYDSNVFLQAGSVSCFASVDTDSDGIIDDLDNCPLIPNPDQKDSDKDGIGDVCDACPLDPDNDIDGDGYCADVDSCPIDFNPGQEESSDNDGVGNACDNCEFVFNPNQYDCDEDDLGDACDLNAMDEDGDGLDNACDNCPSFPNFWQVDSDSDGEGDLCDLDDGLLYFTDVNGLQQSWQDEWAAYNTYNLYRGDLEELRATGVYTQDPIAVLDADSFCDLGSNPFYFDAFEPAPGQAVFYLVTGEPAVVAACGESSLGRDSAGTTRWNDNSCSEGQQLTINFSLSGNHLISLPRVICSPTISSAQDLIAALEAAGLGPATVSRWSPFTDTYLPPPFPIDPLDGLAYRVRVSSPGELVIHAVDSTSTVVLYGPGESVSGTNAISLPFSTPLQDAFDLLIDIGPSAGAVSRLLTETGFLQSYTGTSGTAFPILPGEGYFVTMNQSMTYEPPVGTTMVTLAALGLLGVGLVRLRRRKKKRVK